MTRAASDDAVEIYTDVYAEAPYLEGRRDFDQFARDISGRSQQPGFVLVVVYRNELALGFAMGHELKAGSRWWEGTTEPLSEDFKRECPGRTFAVIELAVRAGHRREGLGSRLHAHLAAEITQRRVSLLVRPDATPARYAYEQWGYSKVDQIQPFDRGPVYDLMLKQSPLAFPGQCK